jgi:hypothetical protein
LCNKYPEYQRINERFEVGTLVDDLSPAGIASALNDMLGNDARYKDLQQNCLKAREIYCWQEQAKTLRAVYERL